MADKSEESKLTSISWPSPDKLRWLSAAKIPIVACIPVITSTSATPTFVGWPGAGPVTLINPPIAWTNKSYPGIAAPAPEPNPVIEQ